MVKHAASSTLQLMKRTLNKIQMEQVVLTVPTVHILFSSSVIVSVKFNQIIHLNRFTLALIEY